jgi:hypothetical protein
MDPDQTAPGLDPCWSQTHYVGFVMTRLICVLISRQLIYNYPEQLFADSGVMAIEHADFEGVERLALVTGNSKTFCLLLLKS